MADGCGEEMSRSKKDARGGHRKPTSWDGRCPPRMRLYGRRYSCGMIQEYRGDGEDRSALRGRARMENRAFYMALDTP